jgi:uncharacterized protein YndB with AHSA1/START domain
MRSSPKLRASVEGALGGALAGVAMNAATTAFLNRQSEASRKIERSLSPGGVPVAAARRMLEFAGVEADEETVRKLGVALHWTFPVVGGIAVGNITHGKPNTIPTSLASAVAMWGLFDEITPWASGTSAPPRAYPVVTHMRGLVGHLVYGAALGVGLSALRSAPEPRAASSITRRRFDAPAEQVFDVLLDPTAYVEWVVGARKLRAIDDAWPAPGSAFHHELARSSGGLRDKTVLVSLERPTSIVLKAYARPVGIADVALHIAPDDTGCIVTIEEKLAEESGRSALNPVVRPLLHLRNVESLRRLEVTVAERVGLSPLA